ncbi:Tetratricopeptide repeat-containing protein [Spirosomataceae bacterium TFI 002]|nr:Tetratricopeptide repeat-containing protein [Spirosomataceae bacterium TFI 002]
MHRIKATILSLSLILLCSISFAQNLSRDALEVKINELEKAKPSLHRDSTLAFFYNDMCEKCVYGNDPRADEFLDRFELAYADLDWNPAEALYYRARGKAFDKAGEYEKSIDLYYKAIKILENYPADPKHLTYSYIMTGFVMTNNGNKEECRKLFKKAEPLALQQEDKSNIIWIYDWLADDIYNDAKSPEDFREALEYYKKVEAFIPFTIVQNLKANNLEGLGKTYWRLNEKELALSYFDQALSEATKNKEGFNLWNIYSQLSYFEEEENKIALATEYAEKALKAAKEFGYNEFITRTHYDLVRLYKKSENFEKSLMNFERYQELTDSLGRNELNAKYKELESKYNSELQENQIKKLLNQQLQIIGYVIIAALLLGFFALIYYINTNKKLKKNNLELLNKNKEIEEALFKGEQQERKRIASDLHDSLATKISAMKWRLEAIPEQENNKILVGLVDQLEGLYTDVRLISHNMAPHELSKQGLKQALEVLFSKLNLLNKTNFTLTQIDYKSTLGKDIQFQLYCMILELSNNVLKHSDAKNAQLKIVQEAHSLNLSFEDNGTNKNKHGKGMGFRNLKSRVSDLNGTLEIESKGGFKVSINIPY